MNKEQKEVQQVFLDSEKETLKLLKANYKDALAEINAKIYALKGRDDEDMQNVIYQIEYQKALKTQVTAILENLHTNNFETISQYLTESYENGFIGTMYDMQKQGVPLVIPIDQKQVVEAIQHDTKLSESLYAALGKDINVLKKQISGEISRGISSSMMTSEIARNISGYADISRSKSMRIARTESHRIQCKSALDAQHKAKEKGADIVKQWDAFLDGNTRDSHRKLDGQIREIDEDFEVDGMTASAPGMFGDPAEDCNCRCALLQRAKWALGDNYTKWSEDAEIKIDEDGSMSQLIDLSDTKTFKEFKGFYKDITGQMTANMVITNNSERVREDAQKINDNVKHLNEYTVNGVKYKVDGKQVVFDSTPREKEVANIISQKLGNKIEIVPRVVYPQGISTPDYLIDGAKYDLKETIGSGKHVLYNMINKKKNQASNFIFDISKSPLDFEDIDLQIQDIYSSSHTKFVNKIIVIENEEIKRRYSR